MKTLKALLEIDEEEEDEEDWVGDEGGLGEDSVSERDNEEEEDEGEELVSGDGGSEVAWVGLGLGLVSW